MITIEGNYRCGAMSEMCYFGYEHNFGNQSPISVAMKHKNRALNGKHLRILPSADVGYIKYFIKINYQFKIKVVC